MLLFADHGLSTAQISSLLFLWSGTAFALEIPSGAWADTVSRRGLLVLGSLLTASGFATWTLLPSYAGFAAGFVLWGVGGSLHSGTFQALLYDELAERGTTTAYPRIIGFASTATEAGALVGILVAAPLFELGGYALVGWASVTVVLAQAVLGASLPAAPQVVSAAQVDDLEDDPQLTRTTVSAGGVTTYVAMLRTGLAEALHRPAVRGGVLLAAVLYGFTAFDEYFGLLARDGGASTAVVPLLVGLTVAGSLAGSLLAGRTAGMRSTTMAVLLVVAAVALAAGAMLGGAGLVGVIGFALVGLGYGLLTNATVVAEARLQDAIEGPARATVTSVAGLISELVALAIFALVALLSLWLTTASLMAVLTVPVAATALAVRRWLPRRRGGPAGPDAKVEQHDDDGTADRKDRG
ncbi:MFS transporter [Aeromicrobium sp. NPDC092404]|uniref:MFS transporter n=1 Tax=Aeromicrobium sp. NPDC092404 TaxID=3154976 RepID=UPI003419952A